MPSTCVSSSGRCSAHSLRVPQHSHIRAASTLAAVAAGNSNSLVSCPWLLQRGAGRQLLPPPAATEDASSAGGPLQDYRRGGSSRGGGVSRGRGGGRGSGSKRSWEGSNSSSGSDRGGVSDGGSQKSPWQAQAQHGRAGGTSSSRGRSSHVGRGGGRINSAGSGGNSSGSDSDNAGTSSGSSRSEGRGSYSGRGTGRSGSKWVQQERSGEMVSFSLSSWQAASSQTMCAWFHSICTVGRVVMHLCSGPLFVACAIILHTCFQ
jgi:hypothetical protein